MQLFIFSFFFTSVFCAETGYLFINDFHRDEAMDMEVITDMSSGGFNFVSNFSGRITTKYIEKEGGNDKFLQTWSNIISTFKRNDEMKINHDAQKLNGTQYFIYADSTGNFSREGVDDNAKEMEEQNTAFMYFSLQGNMLFPLGSDSLHKIGDTWVVHNEDHLTEFPGFENSDTNLIDNYVYTFDKIKKKRGKEIAYISFDEKITMNMVSQTWDESWKMDVVGLLKGKIEYSITDKKVVKCKVRGTIKGTGIDLDDDSSISFYQNMDMICKTKLK